MTFFSLINQSWQTFWKNRKYIPLFVLNDIGFVVLLTIVQKEVFARAQDSLLKVIAALQEEAAQTLTAITPPPALLQSPELIAAAQEVMKYVWLAIFYGFIVWTGAKGAQWYLANKIVKKKVPFVRYAVKFSGINLFWLIAFLVIGAMGINLLDHAFFSALPLFGTGFAHAVTWSFLFVLAYFAFISYCLPPKPVFRQTFVLGVRKWRTLLPVHVVNALILFVAASVPATLIYQHPNVALAISVFLSLPALAFGRVYWATAITKVSTRG